MLVQIIADIIQEMCFALRKTEIIEAPSLNCESQSNVLYIMCGISRFTTFFPRLWVWYYQFHPHFLMVFVLLDHYLCVCVYVCFVDRCLYFCPFSLGYCVVCSSSIYIFWLPLWYLQTLMQSAFCLIKCNDINQYCWRI
jgi:hypothetical protein